MRSTTPRKSMRLGEKDEINDSPFVVSTYTGFGIEGAYSSFDTWTNWSLNRWKWIMKWSFDRNSRFLLINTREILHFKSTKLTFCFSSISLRSFSLFSRNFHPFSLEKAHLFIKSSSKSTYISFSSSISLCFRSISFCWIHAWYNGSFSRWISSNRDFSSRSLAYFCRRNLRRNFLINTR